MARRRGIFVMIGCFRGLAIVSATITGLFFFAPATAQAPHYLGEWPVPGEPWGITIGPDGNLWVSLAVSSVVRKYTPGGQLLLTLGAPGTGPGQFRSPLGVAFTPAGDVFVADYLNDRIQHFSSTANYLGEWSTKTFATDEHPSFIIYHTTRGILYVTNNSLNVWMFNTAGESWGQIGMPYPHMYGLRGIALDPSGKLFLAGTVGAHVARTTPWPERLDELWPTGSAPNQIALDDAGRLWVAHHDGCEVRVYATSGELVFSFGGYGTGPGTFIGAAGIAIGGDGNIYVADRHNHRIQIFGYAVPTERSTWGGMKIRYR